MTKLAISNIAWPLDQETAVAEIMHDMGLEGVEIAPTKIWDSPLTASDTEVRNYRSFWESRGIRIVALQALLFGRADLTIFDNAQKRRETFEYLAGIIRLGGNLGATALVFGSPKNRQVGDRPVAEIKRIAIPFFRDLGDVAAESGTTLCIEPNPPDYGCDFVTTSDDALELVEAVASEGFGLHLDAAGMTLSQEPLELAIEKSFAWLRHFHISEPHLRKIGTGGVDHETCAKALTRLGYKNWVSIEMRPQDSDCRKYVTEVLQQALNDYAPLLLPH